MASIRNLKDNGGNVFYPLTHERAVKDSNGVSLESKLAGLESKSYVEAWDGASTPVVANIPAGVTVTYNTTTYTGTLAASADTIGKIYLVKNGNDYDRYITSQSGSSYSWVANGTTAMDLSGYATDAELGQLEAEVRNLSGRYYGLFASEGDLPEGEEVGYAFVGGTAPFAIYNFDGTSWSDSGASATAIYGEPGEAGVGFQSVASLQDGTVVITLTDGNTITIDLNHNHPAYYSKVAETSNPSGGFLPDVVYSLGTLTGTVTFALAAAVTGNVNHYFWMFDTGGTAPTITWPAGITWADGSAPTVAASKHYEVSIMDGIAAYLEV